MLITKRKPASVGEMLIEEFMEPLRLTQGALAEAVGVQRKHVNELCNNRRSVTAPTAFILARVFGNSPEFWLTCNGGAIFGRRCTPLANASESSEPGLCRLRLDCAGFTARPRYLVLFLPGAILKPCRPYFARARTACIFSAMNQTNHRTFTWIATTSPRNSGCGRSRWLSISDSILRSFGASSEC
jgi:addiction module HigA family antidote